MTPKEKAKELVFKMSLEHDIPYEYAKECALIAVDEILKHESYFHCVLDGATEYWEEVKQEIEKL